MTNRELKYYTLLKQKRHRESENKFLIEGEHLIEECLKSKFYSSNLEKIFIRDDFKKNIFLNELFERKSGIEIIFLSAKAFNQLSETVNSQGIIGVVSKKNTKTSEYNQESKLIAAFDSINDPGNLGTIIRTCYWFDVNKMLLGTGSADLFNSKVIRASQGAIFNLNIEENVILETELEKYYRNEFRIILTDLEAETSLTEFRFSINEKYLVVFGNEAKGISKKILENKNYAKIKINAFTGCESLNISVATGIVLNSLKNKVYSNPDKLY